MEVALSAAARPTDLLLLAAAILSAHEASAQPRDALALPPPPQGVVTRRLDFRGGSPLVPVKLMEGHAEVTLSSRGRIRFKLAGPTQRVVEGAPRSDWRVRRVSGTPATVLARLQLAELPFNDKDGLAAAKAEWIDRGLGVKATIVGGVYGVSGKVIDNRRYVLVVDQPLAPPAVLAEQQAELFTRYEVRTSLVEEIQTEAHITLELVDGRGVVQGQAADRVVADTADGAPIEVRRVEYGVGYDFHNFEDRSFRGSLSLTADRSGKLAVINQVDLEDLLKGLVPSEIFAKAHPEALKAQAVTARGEIMAKIGLKHLVDPYLLCSEQHCAVYKGVSGEDPSTNAAVEATRGEAVFDREGRLVDSVYSAVCGGHTEDNDAVWGGVPNPSLRGRPDLLPEQEEIAATPKDLKAFLASDVKWPCRVSSFSQASKFRWERRLSAKEVDDKLVDHKVGHVMAMTVTERGASGRARLLQISGDAGAATVRGELAIRKAFGMLNSAMFVVSVERDAKGRPATWIFNGGGWGHGVGLCQTGAIGRAEAGQSYRQILDHYFNGALVARIY